MKLEVDMSMITQQGEVLGILDGVMTFEKGVPTVNEQNYLFDENLKQVPAELVSSLQQCQTLESLSLFAEPNHKGAVGCCYFSLFYIPSIELKDRFIEYFAECYGFEFFEYGEDD